MRSEKFSFGLTAVALAALALGAATPAPAQTEKVLFNFGLNTNTGYYTYAGGSGCCRQPLWHDYWRRNTSFRDCLRIVAKHQREYVETILHNFQRYNSTDGWEAVAGVIWTLPEMSTAQPALEARAMPGYGV